MKRIAIFTLLFLSTQIAFAHDIPVLHEHLSVIFGLSAHFDHLVQATLIVLIGIILVMLTKKLFKFTK